ncbi:MAG TPA: aldehyde ferredoxin oxidoreductase C-terminal domain-containing protein [Clostridia bacterium]|nr:aldehyde ferredoxin oxidoreductase C-terminal domain-containing protein [Clostridia bacterium]
MNIEKLKSAHKLLCEYKYELGKIKKGYTNRTLYINLGDNEVKEKPVTQLMKDKFIGGKGFGLWYLWNAVTSETKWNDPENEIVIATGPLGGITQYPGAGKSLVVSLSPLTDMPIDSNVGGYFGPLLKFSGFDALELQGKSDKDVIVFIDGNKGIVRIEEAPLEAVDSHVLGEQLTEMFAESEEDKRNISVVSAGTAAEHSFLGLLNFTFYDVRRKAARLKQAGRGGIGTVFRDKGIKALVVRFAGVKGNLNNPADQGTLNRTGIKFHKQMHDLDDKQNRMRQVGTANIIEVMDQYDLLPTHNYKFGSHKDTYRISSKVFKEKITQGMADGCWYGCSMSCAKAVDNFILRTGPYKGQKVIVDGPEYENAAGLGSNIGIFDPDVVLELNFYCDTYAIDTISFGTMTAFIMECYENGILNKERTGGLELNFGNADAALELIHRIARGEGFGKIAGLGVKRMKELFIKEYNADPGFINDIGMEQKGLEFSEYMPKESLAQQGGYGLTNKGPQHDEAWLIFMDMVNNQIPTFENKAEALHYFPMFRTWFGLNGLCKLPWNDITPSNNKYTDEPAKIPEHVQNYVDIFNAVTGCSIDKNELITQSERVYNFQRIFNIRMGKGKRINDRIPYRAMGPVTVEEYESRQERYDGQLKELLGYNPTGKDTEEKLKVMRKYREDQYEKLTDAVYKRRGWTIDGVPTLEKLKELGMDLPEVVEVVKKHI